MKLCICVAKPKRSCETKEAGFLAFGINDENQLGFDSNGREVKENSQYMHAKISILSHRYHLVMVLHDVRRRWKSICV